MGAEEHQSSKRGQSDSEHRFEEYLYNRGEGSMNRVIQPGSIEEKLLELPDGKEIKGKTSIRNNILY
jgi:hypothetical protein